MSIKFLRLVKVRVIKKYQVSLDRLTKSLAEKPQQEKGNGILLFADETVSYQVLFQILDRVRRAGINQISLQAELKHGS